MKTLNTFLIQNGIANAKTFEYAAYLLAEKLQPVQTKYEGTRLANRLGDVTPDGLVIVSVPAFTLIAVPVGDCYGVSISDFVTFLRGLTNIEIGNLKSGFNFPVELCAILPLGYFHFIKKDRDFHFKILVEWAWQGLSNKELIRSMRKYISAAIKWKWEFFEYVQYYLDLTCPKDLFKSLSEAGNNSDFDTQAKEYGLDELCTYSLPRKTNFAKLIYKMK